MENNTSTNHENGNDANRLLADGLQKSLEIAVWDALGLKADDNWIISASKTQGGAIHFSVHLDYNGEIETTGVEITTLSLDGNWIRLSGWVK
jgi:hypothetical protein